MKQQSFVVNKFCTLLKSRSEFEACAKNIMSSFLSSIFAGKVEIKFLPSVMAGRKFKKIISESLMFVFFFPSGISMQEM